MPRANKVSLLSLSPNHMLSKSMQLCRQIFHLKKPSNFFLNSFCRYFPHCFYFNLHFVKSHFYVRYSAFIHVTLSIYRMANEFSPPSLTSIFNTKRKSRKQIAAKWRKNKETKITINTQHQHKNPQTVPLSRKFRLM